MIGAIIDKNCHFIVKNVRKLNISMKKLSLSRGRRCLLYFAENYIPRGGFLSWIKIEDRMNFNLESLNQLNETLL